MKPGRKTECKIDNNFYVNVETRVFCIIYFVYLVPSLLELFGKEKRRELPLSLSVRKWGYCCFLPDILYILLYLTGSIDFRVVPGFEVTTSWLEDFNCKQIFLLLGFL